MKTQLLVCIPVLCAFIASCNSSSKETLSPPAIPLSDSNTCKEFYFIKSPLTADEVNLFRKLHAENDNLIIPDTIMRCYTARDSAILVNKVVLPKEKLEQLGYVYYDCSYLGAIADLRISYKYSMGTANIGSGTVYGESIEDYHHDFISQGTTAKVLNYFNNGKNILTKTIEMEE